MGLPDLQVDKRSRNGKRHIAPRRAAAVRRNRHQRPGVVVIGGDYQGLGIARSLGRRGFDVLVIDDERSISRYSRYVSAAVKVADLRTEAATLAALHELRQRHSVDGWVLYPTREETVAALSRCRDELAEHFRVPTPPWEVIKWAWDKRHTYHLAHDIGIPAPRTWVLHAPEEVQRIDAEPPFVIKPAIKEHFLYATKCKAWRANSHAELEARFRDAARLIGVSEVMVQELIPGAGQTQLAYCAFFKNGTAVASMVVRRLRQHPVEFGRASTYVQTIDHPLVEEMSLRFLRSINYYGLVELEYKHDERDGAIKLLDVNPRTWGYHTLGQRAGVDFPYLLYADQLGLAGPRALRAPPGIFWIRLATDLPTAAVEFAHHRLDWRGYLRSIRAANTEAVFSRDDPLPGLVEITLLPYLIIKRGF